MDQRKLKFLTAVLGTDGAGALVKAAERSADLEHALIPRTIMAWLLIAGRGDYEGSVPGIDDSYLAFRKSGEEYSGSIGIDDVVYTFESAPLLHVAAGIAVSLGADHERVSDSLRDLDLVRLGKSIDLLVKARIVAEELRKVEPPGQPAAPREPQQHEAPTLPTPTQTQKGPTVGVKPRLPRPQLEGTKPSTPLSPRAAKIHAQSAAPAAAQAAKPILPGMKGAVKPKKGASAKVTKAQADKPCPVCTLRQFRNDTFRGCLCFRELAKSVQAVKLEDGYHLDFAPDMDREELVTLLESLGVH